MRGRIVLKQSINILTLSTLALFVIPVSIGYFISTAVVTKALKADGRAGGCPDITCSTDDGCKDIVCNNIHGACKYGKYDWSTCWNTTQCVNSYSCDKDIGYQGDCFTEIYSNNTCLCETK